MFSGIQIMAVPTDANLANHALSEENTYRFHSLPKLYRGCRSENDSAPPLDTEKEKAL